MVEGQEWKDRYCRIKGKGSHTMALEEEITQHAHNPISEQQTEQSSVEKPWSMVSPTNGERKPQKISANCAGSNLSRPLVRNSTNHVYIRQTDIETPRYGQRLRLTMRTFGQTQSMRAIASMAKHKWRVKKAIQVVKFKEATFTISFQSSVDYLRCVDWTWDSLGDTPMMIRKEDTEIVAGEVYNWIPQWVYIRNIKPDLFVKSAINSIVSVLGPPIMVEYTNTSRHPHSIRVCIQAPPTFGYQRNIPVIIIEGNRDSTIILEVTYDSKTQNAHILKKLAIGQILSSSKRDDNCRQPLPTTGGDTGWDSDRLEQRKNKKSAATRCPGQTSKRQKLKGCMEEEQYRQLTMDRTSWKGCSCSGSMAPPAWSHPLDCSKDNHKHCPCVAESKEQPHTHIKQGGRPMRDRKSVV